MDNTLENARFANDDANSAGSRNQMTTEAAKIIDLDDDRNLNPAVREACYRHLGEYVVLDENGREAAGQLLRLAWLWAHGFVYVEPQEGLAIVEPAIGTDYCFDPVLQEDSTPWILYNFYRLHVLVPLLAA